MRIFITVLIIIAVYVGYEAYFNHGSWQYKLTLVVETPEGQVVGSAVRKVSAYRESIILQFLPSASYAYADIKGEAIVVDLGEKGKFFALLKSDTLGVDYGYLIAFVMFKFPNLYKSAASYEGIRFYQNLKAKKELALEKLPMLVQFRDIKDPKTVTLIDPNDLE